MRYTSIVFIIVISFCNFSFSEEVTPSLIFEVIDKVEQNYDPPSALHPDKMFALSLGELIKEIPNLTLKLDRLFYMGDKERACALPQVKSTTDLRIAYSKIFRWLNDLGIKKDSRFEYAVIRGLLLTLDDRSNFKSREELADDAKKMVKKIKDHPPKGEILPGRVGYLTIINFFGTGGGLPTHFIEKWYLDQISKKPIVGIILDLRGSLGGSLDECEKFAGLFVEKGVIASIVDRSSKDKQTFAAGPGGNKILLPVIVLVDGKTSAGAEIVAGALKQLKRALIIGSKTAGKGTVQTVIELHDGTSLKLTVAHFLLASDIAIDQVGVEPDIKLKQDQKVDFMNKTFRLKQGEKGREAIISLAADILGNVGTRPKDRMDLIETAKAVLAQ